MLPNYRTCTKPPSPGHGTSPTRPPITWNGNWRGIVGFRFTIEALEGKMKLSQNRSEADRSGVTAALSASPDGNAQAIAGMMTARQAVNNPKLTPGQIGFKPASL